MAKDQSPKDSKKSPEGPANKKQLKEARLLLKGVAKFLRYNDDLISEEKKEIIREKETSFREAMEKEGVLIQDLETLAGDLTKTCEKSVAGYKPSSMKENVEVIFVAVVIAMGIRAYFAQPFKIPTGSMQPTLNGVIGHPNQEINPGHPYVTDLEKPGFAKRAWEKMWYGRSWVDIVAEEDCVVTLNSFVGDETRPFHRLMNTIKRRPQQRRFGYREETFLKFFTNTKIVVGVDPKNPDRTYSIPGTISKVQDIINPELYRNSNVKKGQIIARGFVDTGDQVIVDKFSYHWVRPKRGDVFVFTTNDIPYIQRGLPDPRMGSQHYIKRLAGKPGDQLEVKDGKLFIDGEVAAEEGFQRVMSGEDGYRGYAAEGIHRDVTLGEDEYFALGDNSYNSSDGRMWGTVPRKNLVGKAFWVYLPFGHHWGPIH